MGKHDSTERHSAIGVDGIRNLALTGHVGSGKTTLFEALLHAGGAINTPGTVERGTTVSDHDPLEKERQHSLACGLATFEHAGCRINLIDTPGMSDFRGPMLTALAAVETVAVVVNAQAGIQHSTGRMLDYARARGLARMIIVNRIDAEDVDLAGLVRELREAFGNECLPVNLPADGGARVVDCFFNPVGTSDLGDVAQAHQTIIDQVVEINERVMEHYLDKGESDLSGQELHDAFEQCLREGHLVPICFTSARSGVGVAELLSFIQKLAPNPTEGNPPAFVKGVGSAATPITASADPAGHVIADVFKIINDPFVGKLAVFRVYQGTIRKDMQLLIDHGRKPFKVAHLYRLIGREHVEISEAIPGDIAAIAKVDDLHFDAVLHDSHDEDHIHLAPIAFPKPMVGLAVEPATRGQEQKLSNALMRLAEEDPCFHVEHDRELNQTVVRGLSDLHLKLMIERMQQRYGVEVRTVPLKIAYRETIGAPAEGHHRHKKQTGGAGQFGEVYLRIEPLARGSGFEFVDAVVGGAIPGQFIPAVEKGVRQVLEHGAIAGYPLQDVRVTVYDGKTHPVDGKEVAFISAAKKAFLAAIAEAAPQILEPIVQIEVSVPGDQLGDITGRLANKRARIAGTDSVRDELVVRAEVPLAEITEFANELRGLTGGRGSYTLEFSHYEAAPVHVQRQLEAAYKPRHEED